MADIEYQFHFLKHYSLININECSAFRKGEIYICSSRAALRQSCLLVFCELDGGENENTTTKVIDFVHLSCQALELVFAHIHTRTAQRKLSSSFQDNSYMCFA